jgi:hypothetical protein
MLDQNKSSLMTDQIQLLTSVTELAQDKNVQNSTHLTKQGIKFASRVAVKVP